MSRSRLLALVFILLLAAMGLGAYYVLRLAPELPQAPAVTPPKLESAQQLEEVTRDQPLPPPMQAGSPVLSALKVEEEHVVGKKEDPISLVGYLSFQDSYSRFSYQAIRDYQKQNPGALNFVFRHYALDTRFPFAMSGALATECAGELGGEDAFWHFADRLFEDDEIAEGDFAALAAERSIDPQQLRKCMGEFRVEMDIRNKMYQGWRWGFASVPAFFLVRWDTGEVRLVEGAHGQEFMDRLLKEML